MRKGKLKPEAPQAADCTSRPFPGRLLCAAGSGPGQAVLSHCCPLLPLPRLPPDLSHDQGGSGRNGQGKKSWAGPTPPHSPTSAPSQPRRPLQERPAGPRRPGPGPCLAQRPAVGWGNSQSRENNRPARPSPTPSPATPLAQRAEATPLYNRGRAGWLFHLGTQKPSGPEPSPKSPPPSPFCGWAN